MKARCLTALTVAAVLIASAPAATAQAPHKDPSTGGTTGLFTVPVAAVLAPGKFAVNFSYVADAFQPGDSNIETLAVAGSFVFAAAENPRGLRLHRAARRRKPQIPHPKSRGDFDRSRPTPR